jgi:hypothetical protein
MDSVGPHACHGWISAAAYAAAAWPTRASGELPGAPRPATSDRWRHERPFFAEPGTPSLTASSATRAGIPCGVSRQCGDVSVREQHPSVRESTPGNRHRQAGAGRSAAAARETAARPPWRSVRWLALHACLARGALRLPRSLSCSARPQMARGRSSTGTLLPGPVPGAGGCLRP